MSTVSPFTAYLAEHYSQLKDAAASIGRRRAKLGLIAGFWELSAEQKEAFARIAEDQESHEILRDALEDINTLGGEEEVQIAEYVDTASVAGVVVRTDFSDDAAWESFVEKLLEAEQDLSAPMEGQEGTVEGESSQSESEDEEMAGQSTSNTTSSFMSLFAFLSPPPASPLRARLANISNLAALRLVNDVDAVRIASPPPGTQRPSPSTAGHRLSNLHGFVEAYSGPLVWIYDTRSNLDQAARVVSQCAESIGAMTADSWRARASFLPELQLHVVSGAMKIDFGGLDRWDPSERQRNVADSCN